MLSLVVKVCDIPVFLDSMSPPRTIDPAARSFEYITDMVGFDVTPKYAGKVYVGGEKEGISTLTV